jgi:chemotaxis signal transduction protein
MALHNARTEVFALRHTALREAPVRSTRRFVTFPLGGERYALDASCVLELARAERVHRFPHTMTSLEGVVVRRGAAIPVCKVASIFTDEGRPMLHVIARCRYEDSTCLVAIPVSGACEIVEGEQWDTEGESTEQGVTFVAGLLRTGDGTLPLLNLDRVVAHCMQAPPAVQWEGRQ